MTMTFDGNTNTWHYLTTWH